MKAPKDHWIIQIDITNACVHRCSNCTRFCMHQKKPFMMDYDLFCKAVDSIIDHPGLVGIIGGEPTLHPQFEKMCQYLYEKLEPMKRPDPERRALPTDDFLQMYKLYEAEKRELYKYGDGWRSVTMGAGLFTSLSKEFLEHLEAIQDTFMFQCHNDHVNGSWHQPILISRKDMGIGDDEWIKLRERCWVNRAWCGSITPKGCFFYEIAAGLDYMYDGPGGLPIEKGWWKRDISDFEEQFRWCELCGIPLETFSRDARESVTDVSEENLRLMKEHGCIRIDKDHINLVKIKDGKITEDSKARADECHGRYWLNKLADRITPDTPIYAEEFHGVIVCTDADKEEAVSRAVENNRDKLRSLSVLGANEGGRGLRQALDRIGKNKYVFCLTPEIILSSQGVEKLEKCVVNPGTLHYIDFSQPHENKNTYIQNGGTLKSGICLLLNTSAHSLERNMEEIEQSFTSLADLKKVWQKEKIVELSDGMNGAMYGGKEITDNKIRVLRLKNFLKTQGLMKTTGFVLQKARRMATEKDKSLWL